MRPSTHRQGRGGLGRRSSAELREQRAARRRRGSGASPTAQTSSGSRSVDGDPDLVRQRDGDARRPRRRGSCSTRCSRSVGPEREHVRARRARRALRRIRVLARPGRAGHRRPCARRTRRTRRRAVQAAGRDEERERRAGADGREARPRRAGPGLVRRTPPPGRAPGRSAAGRSGRAGRRRLAGAADHGRPSSRAGRRRSAGGGRGRASPLEREVDDPPADGGEVVAALGAHRREQADRREARDRVDLATRDRVAGDQEVDPGEALRAAPRDRRRARA